uniref:Uncharacterized protein n=1 Tax=Ursus maritimus TaxID=29073 RepID=A0A452VPC6_URSMA
MRSIYTMEYYSAIRKNEFSTFATTWTALEEIMLSEISQNHLQMSPFYPLSSCVLIYYNVWLVITQKAPKGRFVSNSTPNVLST